MADPSSGEYQCHDCGRWIIAPAAPPGLDLCAMCMTIPGWFADPELRAILEPDAEWRPPPYPPASPAAWVCEVEGCGRRDALFRVNGCDEPFRGRCPDHLDPAEARRLHARRNSS